MKVNKKALYALAAYYEAIGITTAASKAERVDLIEMLIPCINDAFNEYTIRRSIVHGEVFFRANFLPSYDYPEEGVYQHKFNDANIAKLLRYIARNGKFPRNNSLRYV